MSSLKLISEKEFEIEIATPQTPASPNNVKQESNKNLGQVLPGKPKTVVSDDSIEIIEVVEKSNALQNVNASKPDIEKHS